MNMLMNFVLALQIFTALAMIGLVLIQHGIQIGRASCRERV